MQGIGVLLGLGSSEELPNLTVQSNQPINQPGIATEMVFPGNADIVFMDNSCIDPKEKISIYIDSSCRKVVCYKIETFAERLQDSSLLDTVLRLYKLQSVDRFWRSPATTTTFSQDSLIRIQVSAGTYCLGVSAEGQSLVRSEH